MSQPYVDIESNSHTAFIIYLSIYKILIRRYCVVPKITRIHTAIFYYDYE